MKTLMSHHISDLPYENNGENEFLLNACVHNLTHTEF